ncbi:cation-translocating P-type ATPase [Haladaptatus sp. DYSN1]|uniref:cation-translocating P-type ATPase n=1 Tax=unclassified Haladaptatus TaxID=2622732 RepID=UPI0024063585|nr:cation-translocating P-type ATPase [Haladaptatus sp. DYSN1]
MVGHDSTVEETLSALDGRSTGLASEEAARRLTSHGPNRLVDTSGRAPLTILLAQFRSPLILVLLLAAALSAAIGNAIDALLIAIIVGANGVFGFAQDYRAEQSLLALRELAAPDAVVRRDGAVTQIAASDVVPGDVLLLAQGDAVTADARLIAAQALACDEAALTGESLPVEKSTAALPAATPLAERSNMVYRGTTVTRGRAEAVVVATGMETEVGQIAGSLATAVEPQTPLQRDLDELGRRLGLGILLVSSLLAPLLVVLAGTGLVQAGLTAVSLAVAAIPEGLPAVVTLTLALGVRRMAGESALVRSLLAVEALGTVDVICTDKTGTVTEGEMTVSRVWVPDRVVDLSEPAVTDSQLTQLFEIGVVCNDATETVGDPTEQALLAAAQWYGLDPDAVREAHPRVDEQPFSAETQQMMTVHDDVAFVKGAPRMVLDRASHVRTEAGIVTLDEPMRARILEQTEAFAAQALRVLAFAARTNDGPLVFVGLQGMLDPPRAEVSAAVADCQRAGIDVKLVTGDNRTTATVIAKQIGLRGATLDGTELDALSDEALAERIDDVAVFARATPTHKVRILEALQARGHVVAMTGDGVNDAPALKRADVGVAMGIRGTDVAAQSSDIVLLDDNFATIRTAIRNGRAVFDNIWKFVAYLLSANFAEVVLVFVASLAGYLILPAVQLLWINLLTDGLPALALGVDEPGEDVMDRTPRASATGIVDRPLLGFLGGAGLAAALVMLALMVVVLDGAPTVTPYALTMVFTGFVLLEFVKLFVVRWLRETPFVNLWLFLAVAGSLLAQLAVVYSPLRTYFGTVRLTIADWRLLAVTVAGGGVLFVLVALLVKRFDARTHS